MATNYPVLPTLETQVNAARKQGMDFGMQQLNAAQQAGIIRAQQQQNALSAATMEDRIIESKLGRMRNETAMYLEKINQTPQMQQMMSQQAITDAANKLSESSKINYQNAIDALDPAVETFKKGDARQAIAMLQQAGQNPAIASQLSNPNSPIGKVYRGLMSGNPQSMAQAYSMLNWGKQVVGASSARAGEASRSGAIFESKLRREEEAAKQAAITKRELETARIKAQAEAQGKPPAVPSATELEQAKRYYNELTDQGLFTSFRTSGAEERVINALAEEAKAIQTNDKNKSISFREAFNQATQKLGVSEASPTPSTMVKSSPQDDWVTRAMQANPGMSREAIVAEGVRINKLPSGYK